MAEAALQASMVRWLNRLPGCIARVNGPGPAHVAGDPDIYGCLNGQTYVVEVKQVKGRLTRLQEHRLQQWRDAGAQATVARSLDELQAWLWTWADPA